MEFTEYEVNIYSKRSIASIFYPNVLKPGD